MFPGPQTNMSPLLVPSMCYLGTWTLSECGFAQDTAAQQFGISISTRLGIEGSSVEPDARVPGPGPE